VSDRLAPDTLEVTRGDRGMEEKIHEQGHARRAPDARSGAALAALGNGAGERTEYHNVVAWDRLAEICGQFLSKGQLVDVEGRLQTRQWDDDAGKRHWKTEVVVASLEMLSGRGKKDYAREAQAVAAGPEGSEDAPASGNGTSTEPIEELVAL
jgi:single-strand DNA-binding protein